ncbi:hypothetical protein ACVWXO_001301 [Bradyrhizobium sp. LM2.7]
MNAAIIRRHHSGLPAHPNELDRWRIVRALTKREHYRYVSPKVTAVAGGYLVESPCCSGNINAEGGLVDVALLHHDRDWGGMAAAPQRSPQGRLGVAFDPSTAWLGDSGSERRP